MWVAVSRHVFKILLCVALVLINIKEVVAQKVLGYGKDELTAAINYNVPLWNTYKKHYSSLPVYPVKGAYTPSHYCSYERIQGSGACNYIYLPTNEKLIPGHQYRMTLTVKVVKAFSQMPYFKSHFGVALSSDLLKNNYFGLWVKPYVHLDIDTTEALVINSFVFRPLCTSKYLALGVFQGPDMDKQDCFLCQYGFELYDLLVEEWGDPKAEFVYMCDAFEEERLKKEFTTGYETDTVFFESGSYDILSKYTVLLDSVPFKLRSKQDLITLYGYTDKNGNDNESLGAARNEAIRKELMLRGVDSARIMMVNYGESQAADRVSMEDRKVEIDINRGKIYQKYYTEALQAAMQGDFQLAKSGISKWIKIVPPENAILALFDCWGEGEEADSFRKDLEKSIRSRLFYKGDDMKFTLDSLSCEDQKIRTLPLFLAVNRLPDFQLHCDHSVDSLHDLRMALMVDRIFTKHGFPTIEKYGERGNQVLPFIIVHSKDTTFQIRYLPIVRRACEELLIDWDNYALLYDKISISRCGKQRYGTQWQTDEHGKLLGLYPFEDEVMVAEYRKQVGLVPLSDF